ncbi:MAG: hypothetical protein ACNA8W_03270 [Bradymonadaceae bacterium]
MALALLLVPAYVDAAPGDGVRSGNLQLNPGLMVGAGYDTNLYYQSGRETRDLRQAPHGILEPRLKMSIVEPTNFDFNFDAALGWTQYFHDENIVRRQSGLSTTLIGSGIVNPNGAVSLRVTERFVRTNEPPNAPTAARLNRIGNRLGATLGFHPGGRVLESFLGYDYVIHRHNLYPTLDRNEHHVGWKNQWRFLPKTGFVLNADYRVIRYNSDFQGGSSVRPDGRLHNANSTPIRLTGGVSGLITNRISLRILGGYGWGLYEAGPTIEGPLAHVEATYLFGAQALRNRFRLGYELNFSDSVVGNYYSFHRFYTNYEQGILNNRLRFSLGADAQMRNYSRLEVRVIETDDRVITLPADAADLLVGVQAGATYHISNAWSAGIQYGFGSNFTDDIITIDGPGRDAVRDYQRHHVMVSTTLTY